MLLDKIVNNLVLEHGTRDPFRIATERGIKTTYEDLGLLNGFYSVLYRCKMIHINQNTSRNTQNFTCAHELAHDILHEGVNICFLRKNTYLNSNKYENQANEFAVRLVASTDGVESFIERASREFMEVFDVSEDIAKSIARHHVNGNEKMDFSLAGTLSHEKLSEMGVLSKRNYIENIKDGCQFQSF